MIKLTEEEKEEFKKYLSSNKLKESFKKIFQNKHNPFIINNEIDISRWITFLIEYNYFINHSTKQFRKILDKKNKL